MVERTDDLIARLSADAKPVKRLLSPARRLTLWAIGAAGYVIVMTAAAGHSGLTGAVGLDVWQDVAACVLALTAAYAAFVSVLPDRRLRGAMVGAVLAAAVWFVLLAEASLAEFRATGIVGGVARETDWPCVIAMLAGGGALAAFMLVMLRRGVPLAPRQTVGLAAIAAAAIASIEACISRPHAFISTILVWHGATCGVLVLALVVNAGRFLSWGRSPSMSEIPGR